jgi:thiamine-phosphate pyrophosphorylase
MPAIGRVIDANANRAREAMRTMEDTARFGLDDARLCEELRHLRHELRAVLDSLLPPGSIEAWRDTPGDVGTRPSTPAMPARAGLAGIAAAAGKRLTEALRVLEECAAALEPHAAAALAQLRYRAYDLDQRLLLRLGSGRAVQWTVCVILTESLCVRDWRDVVRESVRGGADCIQVREKSLGDATHLRRVREVIDMVRTDRTAVVVNDRVDLALLAGADGVHLGADDLSIRDARRLAGRSLLVGASTHDLAEAARAVEAGADYCGVGAMFASALKPERKPAGPAWLQAFLERYPRIPHVAIGGINASNVRELAAAGARGVAVSSAVCAARDPGAVVASLRAALDQDRLVSAAPP